MSGAEHNDAPLSEAEMALFSPLRKRLEDQPEGFPPIGKHGNTLLRQLRLESTRTPTGLAYRISRELITEMVDEEISCLTTNCPTQTEAVSAWLKKQFRYAGTNSENSATAGALTVFKALHLSYGSEFIDWFGTLNPQDISTVLTSHNRPVGQRYGLLANAERDYRLPEYQFGLRLCLLKVADISPIQRAALDGGITMFRALEDLDRKKRFKTSTT